MIRGPSRNARSPSSRRSGASFAAAISARRPGRRARRASAIPRRTRARFSPSQRDQVGDRRQRDQVELGLDRRRPAQRRRQLVGDAGPAELGERVAGDDRVQDRAPGQLRARLMVVGDDHLEPGAERRLDLGDGADPAVGGQQQRGAALGQLGDGRLGEPVAVLEPAGDQPVALGAQLAQRADQDRGRADAVDVVVAVHGDPAPGGDRGPDPLDHLRHRVELERVVVLGRGEERSRLLDRPVAAPDQGDGDRLGEAEPAHQRPRLAVVEGRERERAGGGSRSRRHARRHRGRNRAPRTEIEPIASPNVPDCTLCEGLRDVRAAAQAGSAASSSWRRPSA